MTLNSTSVRLPSWIVLPQCHSPMIVPWVPWAGLRVDGTPSHSSDCGCPEPCLLWSTPTATHGAIQSTQEATNRCMLRTENVNTHSSKPQAQSKKKTYLCKKEIFPSQMVFSSSLFFWCQTKCLEYSWAHLIQGSHRDFAYVVRDVLPGGALRVAGSHSLSVPQVTYTWAEKAYKRHSVQSSCSEGFAVNTEAVSLPFSSTV